MQTLDHEQQVALARQDHVDLEIDIRVDREISRMRAPRATDAGSVLRWTAALLLLGAAGIHFGVMGQHAGVSWTHGLFFAVVAWGQVGLAGLLVLRPTRLAIVGAVLANSAIIGVWAVSRTVGIAIGSDGTPDPAKFIDVLCTVFEAVAVGLLLLVLARAIARRPMSAGVGWAGIGFVGLVVAALTSLGFSPAFAGGDGHNQAGATGALAATGHVHGIAGAGSRNADEVAELQPDKPLDNATRDKVAQQLTAARQVALRYPTVADAQRAGMIQAGEFAPGVGAHYVSLLGSARGITPNGEVDPSRPGSFIYDGISPTSRLVGLMYQSLGTARPPQGFAGPNDHWHRHSNLCIKYGAGGIQVPFPADSDVTRAQCDRVHGTFMKQTIWMVHAWVVPGWESPLGVFSHSNPNLHCANGTDKGDKVGFCQGT